MKLRSSRSPIATSTMVFAALLLLFTLLPTHGQTEDEGREVLELISAGKKYFEDGNPGALRIAAEKFSQASVICERIQAKECSAAAYYYLGEISLREDDIAKATELLERSWNLFEKVSPQLFSKYRPHLLLARGAASLRNGKAEDSLIYLRELASIVSDLAGMAKTQTYIGDALRDLKKRQEAIDNYKSALDLFHRALVATPNDISLRSWEIAVLNNLASISYEYGDFSSSIAYNRKILELQKGRNETINSVQTLINMHMIAAANKRSDDAFAYLNEALALSGNNRNLEAYVLGFAISTNQAEGNSAEVLKLAKKILPIKQEQFDVVGQADLLTYIAGTYLYLGDYLQAVSYYERAISTYRSDRCRSIAAQNGGSANYCRLGETAAITGTSKALKMLGRRSEALELLLDELNKIESSNDPKNGIANQTKGFLLNVLGQIYFEMNQNEKAVKYFAEALSLINSRNLRSSSSLLTDIGNVQAQLSNTSEALQSYNQALTMLRPFSANLTKGRENSAGYTLTSLMLLHKTTNPKLAIFYGKQAVRAYQQNREKIRETDKDTQKLFLKSVEFTYRILAELLIEQKRDAEGWEVLDSLKDQQFFDFAELRGAAVRSISATDRESRSMSNLEAVSDRLYSAEINLDAFRKSLRDRTPDENEASRLDRLENQARTSLREFSEALRLNETEFAGPKSSMDTVSQSADLTQLQKTLRELSVTTKQKPIIVYQLAGEDSLKILVVSADDVRSVAAPVKSSELNAKAIELWALLQSPRYDPTMVSKIVYDFVFKPIESILPKDTGTILWSLDGNLRYVPMSALFDGERYLAERFGHVSFSRNDRRRLTRTVQRVWTATGLGTSEQKTVELSGARVFFNALPGVDQELALLFRSNPNGDGFDGAFLQNGDFNRRSMLEALKQKRPLVHIASHFSFSPGDESRSFLLLGDGTAFTLEEMKREQRLFDGVDLLTLSACNTAATQPDANGREIDGFAELAQRLGAGAVMATLWPVSDSATPAFMREFYGIRQRAGGTNKADALRRAQLLFLKPPLDTVSPAGSLLESGNLTADTQRGGTTQPSVIVELDESAPRPYVRDPNRPFAHPYYWAPFVLFGNWK